VLGLGEKWEGGDVRSHTGGGHKINLFKKELLKHKDNSDMIIMFTDRCAYHLAVTCISIIIFSLSWLFSSRIGCMTHLPVLCMCLQL